MGAIRSEFALGATDRVNLYATDIQIGLRIEVIWAQRRSKSMTHREKRTVQRDLVSAYCKVSVDQIDGRWCAKLEGRSAPIGSGPSPDEAIQSLFANDPSGRFEIGGKIALDGTNSESHQEFIVTLRERRKSSHPILESGLNASQRVAS
jgi:hypothetical protein